MIQYASVILRKIVEIFFGVLFYIIGKPIYSQSVAKTVELYSDDSFAQLFTQVRLWDSPFIEIEKIVPKKGKILDLGCGDGFFAHFLSTSSNARELFGIELNGLRLKNAPLGKGKVHLQQGDILNTKFPKADVITLIHVLHHLPSPNSQIDLLSRCYASLKPKGSLIIAEIDYTPKLKYLFTYFIDSIVVPILFDGKLFDPKIFYRSRDEWVKLLHGIGFTVSSRATDAHKPFSHILIVAKK